LVLQRRVHVLPKKGRNVCGGPGVGFKKNIVKKKKKSVWEEQERQEGGGGAASRMAS